MNAGADMSVPSTLSSRQLKSSFRLTTQPLIDHDHLGSATMSRVENTRRTMNDRLTSSAKQQRVGYLYS
jgi:hypothetical protein